MNHTPKKENTSSRNHTVLECSPHNDCRHESQNSQKEYETILNKIWQVQIMDDQWNDFLWQLQTYGRLAEEDLSCGIEYI